ncbi:2-acyl-glycerophospho-ethanolamine acyltransferase [Roseovarius sp. THAF9]|uniref:lysophospholipid acyltransferase family protein n=1 Tax=Roseovarius sp. THAF9 TaxID=2587847 RepID=UPI00126793BB|nr:lysophospholipid acyltransferase family protein [Roseovarius sp. THAF9]QFT91487.1 2-acyl-glycerophospho-ethanolamine acyltransferase [Roseovarius sp. THAF9]
MRYAIQWVRSAVFVGQIYFMMLPIGIVFLPWALLSSKGANKACKTWCTWVRWSARWMVNVRTEVRGTPPQHECLIVAKHQSFLDIILIFGSVPAGKFIMKRELMYAPIIGQYALKLGCVPVDRGKRSQAIKKMIADVGRGRLRPGQLIIYPQGTRIAPGVKAPYKVGSSILYEEMAQECIPVATNVGLVWPRKGVMRHPGTGVVEFLPAIEAGLPKEEFMARLEDTVESNSNRLMREAGFEPDGVH